MAMQSRKPPRVRPVETMKLKDVPDKLKPPRVRPESITHDKAFNQALRKK